MVCTHECPQKVFTPPSNPWTGPDGYTSLRLPDFRTVSTWKW